MAADGSRTPAVVASGYAEARPISAQPRFEQPRGSSNRSVVDPSRTNVNMYTRCPSIDRYRWKFSRWRVLWLFFFLYIYICISFFEKCVSIIELYNYIYCIFEVNLIISILKLQVAKKKRRNKIEVGEKRCIFNYINIRVKRSREFIIFFNLMKRLKSNFKMN